MVSNHGQHSRRLNAVARRLTDPEKQITIWDTYKAIEELEADPERRVVLGMPIERWNTLVVAEVARLEALLGEQ